MDGHITPSFAIGYNLRSPSPGKFLPPPSPANVFPLSNDIGGTPGTFYALIACLPQLLCSIAFLFPFYFRAASPISELAGWVEKKCFLAWPLCISLRGKNYVECPFGRQRGLSQAALEAFLPQTTALCPEFPSPRQPPPQRCAPSSNSSLCSQRKSYLRELSHLPPGIVNKQTSSGILRTATGC